ncbi:hypothetical protein [Brevundimonas sp.]|uniref:hypothetical protein n=1 Tax=Brevundimonas sp. TaxID=1871086 RepID=UPI0035626C27
MADNPNRPDEDARFETNEVDATRGREQGLGVGARELRAQRDPGDVQSRDDEDAHVGAAEDDKDGLDQVAGNNADGAEGPVKKA